MHLVTKHQVRLLITSDTQSVSGFEYGVLDSLRLVALGHPTYYYFQLPCLVEFGVVVLLHFFLDFEQFLGVQLFVSALVNVPIHRFSAVFYCCALRVSLAGGFGFESFVVVGQIFGGEIAKEGL